MRSFLRAGLVLGLLAAACKESAGPGDFSDPVAVTTDLDAAEGAFDSDAYRSFAVTTTLLDPAAPAGPALRPAMTLLGGTLPKLERTSARVSIQSALQAQRLQQLKPAMSAAAAQGRLIPDSLYGRVFQWDATLDEYSWQDSTVSGLNGVRFILYGVDELGVVIEPVVEVGQLDIIDESTTSTLQLHILVQAVGGTPTYVDYTATVSATATSFTANASGFITNGLTAGSNRTLTFDETFAVTNRVTVNATFTLNNPARTFTMAQAVTLDGNAIVITADFRFIRPGETVQLYVRITLADNQGVIEITISAAVRVNGQTVATISGDPADPATEWVDAGGEPLTPDDVTALERLEEATAAFQEVVTSLLLPVQTLAPAQMAAGN